MKQYPSKAAHLLNPQQLDDSGIKAVSDLLAEGQSANTQRSYMAALRYWAAWYAMRYAREIELPLLPAAVIQFIVDHADRTTEDGLVHELPADIDAQLVQKRFKAKLGALSLSTLDHRVSVLSQLHRLRALANPCEDPSVRQLLTRIRRAYAARGVRIKKTPALTFDLIQKLLGTCDDSLVGKRDRALLLFAVASGGRRRSEIVQARIERLQRIGDEQFVYVMGQTKTNQSALEDPAAYKPVTGDAGRALKEWLSAARVVDGPIFRRIYRGGRVGGALNGASVRRIVKERAEMAGVPGDFSAHSLRSGFLTEAGRKNVPLAEAMALSGHASVKVALGYFRTGNVLESSAGKLFDQTPSTKTD